MKNEQVEETVSTTVNVITSFLSTRKPNLLKGNIRVRFPKEPYEVPLIELLDNDGNVSGYHMMVAIPGVPSDALCHQLVATLYLAGYAEVGHSDRVLSMCMPCIQNNPEDHQGKPHGTLLHDAVELRDRVMEAAKMAQLSDSCLYLIWYDHNANYQPRLVAVSEGSLVYTEDITDSPWYTASEIAWMIAASITGSGGKYRITKQPVDCRLFGVPKDSIYSVFLIENNR